MKQENYEEMPMIERYHHTQKGYLMIYTLGIALVFDSIGIISLLKSTVFEGMAFTVLLFVFVTLVCCLILFSSLSVVIKDDILEVRFGPGIIRKKFFLKDIESCHQVKNSWYYGWGIRLTSHGLLYNVSGLDAVEIKLKSGKKYRIGTDVPLELESAIVQSIKNSSF